MVTAQVRKEQVARAPSPVTEQCLLKIRRGGGFWTKFQQFGEATPVNRGQGKDALAHAVRAQNQGPVRQATRLCGRPPHTWPRSEAAHPRLLGGGGECSAAESRRQLELAPAGQ